MEATGGSCPDAQAGQPSRGRSPQAPRTGCSPGVGAPGPSWYKVLNASSLDSTASRASLAGGVEPDRETARCWLAELWAPPPPGTAGRCAGEGLGLPCQDLV